MANLWYLATAYTNHPSGHDAAYKLACKAAADCLAAHVLVYSPVAHSHGIAEAAPELGRTAAAWRELNTEMMRRADGLIIVTCRGYEMSAGIAIEYDCFRAAGKPILFVEPEVILTNIRRIVAMRLET